MEITIRHLSGSRAGQEQTFGENRITLGRNPTNDVAFDPQADSIVSGKHVELTPRHDGWLLRDLGSSNGTFVNDERVTEHVLRPQEVVQLGKNGPRLQFNFTLPDGVHASAIPQGNAPVEGRTVMMMMNEGVPASMAPAPAGFPASAHSAPAFTPAAPVKKKGGVLRALLLVILVLGFLMVAGLAAVIYIRSGSKETQTATKTAPSTAQTQTSTAAATTAPVAATTASASVAEVTTDTTGTQASTSALTTPSTSTAIGTSMPDASGKPLTMTDLEQQLARSQQLIDGLQKQLQETNDRLQKTIQEKDAAIQRAVRDRNAALKRARDAEARAQSQSLVFPLRPEPVQVAGFLSPSVLASLSTMQIEDQTAGSAPIALSRNKKLKKRIAYVAEVAEIPLPNMPSSLPASLGSLIIQSLGSTGEYLATGRGGDAAISVLVTNYKSDIKTNVDTQAVARGIGAISGVLGGPSVRSPVNTKSITMDADMSTRVKLIDPDSVELGEVYAEASSRGRKTAVDVGGLDINQIANTDTALGDVTRKVAADSVEYLLAELESIEWQGRVSVSDKNTNTFTIDCGTACQIEAGDVFGVYDGTDKIGSGRVKKVAPETAIAEVTSGEVPKSGQTVRYDGRTDDSPLTRKSQKQRTMKTRTAVEAYAGPGATFATVKKLKAGANLNFVYSVGTWAKVSDGASSFWIPLASAQITG